LKGTRYPLTLPLKPGLAWRGKLKVEGREGAGYLVSFDAEIIDPEVIERYVYDRTVLTAERLEAWTGWRDPRGADVVK
jgi:hypothetical protein